MKWLTGCEYSAIEREALAAMGNDAWSCDLLDTEVPGKHIKGDLRDIINDGWDAAILHPPCQYLCNSGVRWLFNEDGSINQDRWAKMEEAAEFFKFCLNAPIPRIAVENPIMHKYARKIIGIDYTQLIQPYEYGHGETKATCLWLKNLPPLRPTNIVEGREHRIHEASPGPDRWKERSRAFPGIAAAMAAQWGHDHLRPCLRQMVLSEIS